jgi:nucleotide-binding universal stress UspA family protein
LEVKAVFDKLLVPLDGSEVSESVLPVVMELAKRCNSKVTLLETVESLGQAIATMAPVDPVMVTPDTTEQIVEGVEAEQEAAEEYLTSIAARFKAEGIEAGWVVLSGSPGNEIIDYALKDGSQAIAMASHGRGGLDRVFRGSVAEHVLHHAKVPVLYVRYEHHK